MILQVRDGAACEAGCVAYARVALCGVASPLGASLGCVAVGDSFVWPSLVLEAESEVELPLLQGERGLLTGDRCAPYVRAWCSGGGREQRAAARVARRLRDPHATRATVYLSREGIRFSRCFNAREASFEARAYLYTPFFS